MNFDACGPFPVPRTWNDYERWRVAFWEDAAGLVGDIEGLKHAIGCYAFGLHHRDTYRPWYVGKTLSSLGFAGEIFQNHKLEIYQNVTKNRMGDPYILLFPLMTYHWKFSKSSKSSASIVDWLEKTLIGMAISRNPKISNVRDTKMLRTVYVNGIIGGQYKGRPPAGPTCAKSTFLARG